MLEDLIEIIGALKKDMEANIPILNKEIDSIIKNKEKSPQKIEWVLDTLLDYVSMGIGENQFIELNSYYSSIHPKYSAEYDKYYHEIIDEQS
jgi:hypothetical protein